MIKSISDRSYGYWLEKRFRNPTITLSTWTAGMNEIR